MIFQSDLMIKRNKQYFLELKNKYGIEYIDAYLISGIIGFQNKVRITNFLEKEDEQNDLSLPRTVLTKRIKKLDYIWSLIYLLEFPNEQKNVDFFKKVFESNDSKEIPNYFSIDRIRIFHEYALAGIEILYNEIVGKIENEALSIEDCLYQLIEDANKVNNQENINDFFD